MNIPKSQLTSEQKSRKKTGEEVYFQGNKKNELNDLRKYFKGILYDESKAFVRKQIIRRIINDTTRGVDTSRLFPEMVLASSTKDLVEKKMIYFYLINFSKGNQNFARMAINTFLKDANSQNPNVRALSLRHLSNLRFKGRDQYVMPLLKKGLNDSHPLVKKSCIMGLTKIISEKQKLMQEPQREQQILNELYSLIRDPDTSVICCALEAINEIEPEGLVMNKKLATYLIDNIENFTEYQLPIVLKYYELYEPKTQQQIVNSMNILYPKLRSSILSVTLAIVKIYLRYAQLYPQYLQNIVQKIKRPLLSFLNNQSPEVEYVALKHIEYLIEKFHLDCFQKDIKKFFIQYNEKTYIKIIKIKIIELNTKEDNFVDMICELAEYLNDQEVSKPAVKALQRLMMKAGKEKDSKFIIKTIIKVIETTWNDYLCNNALPTIRNFLRKHNDQFGLLKQIFYTLVAKATQNQAKCSIIQIIGQYGEQIEDAIELIEWNEKETSSSVKIALLRANVKLFLKRPLEMLNLVTTMFSKVLSNDEEQLYVRDYAAFLYRGLEKDIEQFKALFLSTRQRQELVYVQAPKLQINTLQIVYQKQEYKWLIQKDKFLDDLDQEMEFQSGENMEADREEEYSLQGSEAGRKTSTDIKNAITFESIYRTLEAEDFDNEFQIDAQEFQNKWEEYEVGASITRIVKNIELINEQNLQELFKIWNIGVMASAEDDDTIKLYLYCKIKHEEKSEIALLEFQVIKIAQTMTLMIKSEDEELSGFISKYIEQFLKLNQII